MKLRVRVFWCALMIVCVGTGLERVAEFAANWAPAYTPPSLEYDDEPSGTGVITGGPVYGTSVCLSYNGATNVASDAVCASSAAPSVSVCPAGWYITGDGKVIGCTQTGESQ